MEEGGFKNSSVALAARGTIQEGLIRLFLSEQGKGLTPVVYVSVLILLRLSLRCSGTHSPLRPSLSFPFGLPSGALPFPVRPVIAARAAAFSPSRRADSFASGR